MIKIEITLKNGKIISQKILSKTKTRKKTVRQTRDFISKERVYKFPNKDEDYEQMALAQYLYKFFDRYLVNKALHSFDIRVDTRYKKNGYYGSVIPIKDCNGKMRDVMMMLFDSETGKIVKNGELAYSQKTSKQNSNLAYEINCIGDKCCSMREELSKGYEFIYKGSLFGMEKINDFESVGICNNPINAIFMSLLCPDRVWIATISEHSFFSVFNPIYINEFQGKEILVYPKSSENGEVEKIEADYLQFGLKVEIPSYAYGFGLGIEYLYSIPECIAYLLESGMNKFDFAQDFSYTGHINNPLCGNLDSFLAPEDYHFSNNVYVEDNLSDDNRPY